MPEVAVQVIVVLKALPNWSSVVAVNCWCPPPGRVTEPGATVMLAAALLTTTVAVELETVSPLLSVIVTWKT